MRKGFHKKEKKQISNLGGGGEQLTAGEYEVALVLVQGELAELHGLAHHRDVAPEIIKQFTLLERSTFKVNSQNSLNSLIY